MDFKTYVQSVVASYVEKQNRNLIFIKHYNTLDITREKKKMTRYFCIMNMQCTICTALMRPFCSGYVSAITHITVML